VQQISLFFSFEVTLQMPAKIFFHFLSSATAGIAGNTQKKAFTRWLMFHENKLLSIYFNKTSTAKLNAALKAFISWEKKKKSFALLAALGVETKARKQQSNDISTVSLSILESH
jgi:hypothetical protein